MTFAHRVTESKNHAIKRRTTMKIRQPLAATTLLARPWHWPHPSGPIPFPARATQTADWIAVSAREPRNSRPRPLMISF
jgi:hypothetical protein